MRRNHPLFYVFMLLLLALLSTSSWADIMGKAVFASGRVAMEYQQQSKHLNQGDDIPEGARLTTGEASYLYIKTIDNGFFILRPNSEARISAYRYDPAAPEKTKIRLELNQGIARSISGDGAQQSKEQFRFNTPVAAIGIRGTDFTTYTTDSLTRIAVQSGGIVVSGFGSDCQRSGAGPCEGAFASELFAHQKNNLLQVSIGSQKAELLKVDDAQLHLIPNQATPPGPDEPPFAGGSPNPLSGTVSNQEMDYASLLESSTNTSREARMISWGRWRDIADLPASTSTEVIFAKEHELIGLNPIFALTKAGTDRLVMPREGRISFKLADHEGYFYNDKSNQVIPAQASNGVLDIDFNLRSFTTSLNLDGGVFQTQIRAVGYVQGDGRLQGDQLRSNAAVAGIVTGRTEPDEAGYLYQKRIDPGLSAVGATYWKR